jgi:hypothetical protein
MRNGARRIGGLGERNIPGKTNPTLKPWNKLSESEKEYDCNAVRVIPEILEKAKLGIFRLN